MICVCCQPHSYQNLLTSSIFYITTDLGEVGAQAELQGSLTNSTLFCAVLLFGEISVLSSLNTEFNTQMETSGVARVQHPHVRCG